MNQLSDRSYRNILDSISDGVYLLSAERKIVYWNDGAQRLTGFAADEVIGRCCCDNILTHMDQNGQSLCRGSCPAMQTLADGQTREARLFVHHKDGYRVPVHVTVSPVRDEDGRIAGVVEVFRDDSPTLGAKGTIEFLKKLAMHDSVTGLPNKRYVEARLAARIEELKRFGWPVGVLLAEVDHFQALVQEHGQAVADRVLKMVGATLNNSLRSLDAVGRWGERQFLAVISSATAETLEPIAERARMLVESSYLTTPEGVVRATVSIGAVAVDAHDPAEKVLKNAEACVYRSKSAGRNRVTLHTGG